MKPWLLTLGDWEFLDNAYLPVIQGWIKIKWKHICKENGHIYMELADKFLLLTYCPPKYCNVFVSIYLLQTVHVHVPDCICTTIFNYCTLPNSFWVGQLWMSWHKYLKNISFEIVCTENASLICIFAWKKNPTNFKTPFFKKLNLNSP